MEKTNASRELGDRPIGLGEQAAISYNYHRSLIRRAIIDDRYVAAIGPVQRTCRADSRDLRWDPPAPGS